MLGEMYPGPSRGEEFGHPSMRPPANAGGNKGLRFESAYLDLSLQ